MRCWECFRGLAATRTSKRVWRSKDPPSSANRDTVLQATLGPLGILAALDLQTRAFAGVVTLTAAGRITADLVTGQAQAAMLTADFHSAMAVRRCRWVAEAKRWEWGGTKSLRTAENTLTNRCSPSGDRKPCIACSRRRKGRCEFSARLLSPLCERCSTSGMI